ncbi:SDR family NAD(P)-dependent oxidoreductase [Monashia sp. NPDC004114]
MTGVEGKVVLLTGGTMGIGAGLAEAFRDAHARLVVSARHVEDATDDHTEVRADVGVSEDRERLVAEVVARHGRIDVLVNNAGYAQAGPAENEPLDGIARTVETNLVGAMHLCQLAAEHMANSGGGSIVNVASVSAFAVMDRYGLASYTASKAGLVALTRELAYQWGPRGIRVNAVSPGWFPTRMNGFLEDGDQRAWIDAHTSLRRPGLVGEMVGPVLFLAGEDSSYVTGQTLRVDGGWV